MAIDYKWWNLRIKEKIDSAIQLFQIDIWSSYSILILIYLDSVIDPGNYERFAEQSESPRTAF